MSVTAPLVLAAGRGRRFDPGRPAAKLIAPLGGRPVILCTVLPLLDQFGHCHVVLHELWRRAPALTQVADQLTAAGATLLYCPAADLGMGRSLAFGIDILARSLDPDRVLVSLADMPWIRAETLAALAALGSDPELIAAPSHDGRRGHPVLFGRSHLPALAGLDGDQGARALLQTRFVTSVAVDDPGVLRDIDTLADLIGPDPQSPSVNPGPGPAAALPASPQATAAASCPPCSPPSINPCTRMP